VYDNDVCICFFAIDCFVVAVIATCREPTLTTRTKSFDGCLDYVWLSKQHWTVQSTLPMPYKEPQDIGPPEGVSNDELSACPNKTEPSDHLAVGCDATLLPVAGAAVAEVAQALEVLRK
jgi:mRNA deadenylase 3'-5' endonuclease subunit Ccr4